MSERNKIGCPSQTFEEFFLFAKIKDGHQIPLDKHISVCNSLRKL